MQQSILSQKAVIYCRSVNLPKSAQDDVVIRQETNSQQCADKHNIEVLEIFRDSATSKPPLERTGFRCMCEYIHNIEQPVMVLVEDYFAISRNHQEMADAFQMVRRAYGSDIFDIAAIDAELKLQRFEREAQVDVLLTDMYDFMKLAHVQSARFWDAICDVSDDKEPLQQ